MDTGSISAKMRKCTGFSHGLLHAVVNVEGERWHILVTHLHPHESGRRRREIAAILGYMEPYLAGPLLLIGDLNSLSPLDREVHSHESMLANVMLGVPKLKRKFCGDMDGIDYEPMRLFYAAGLVDAGAPKHIGQPDLASTTVPTPANRDVAHIGGRLDYILLGPALASGVGRCAVAQTVKDEATEYISDHYPVILELP